MEAPTPKWVLTTRPVIPPYSEQPTIKVSNPQVTLRPLRVSDVADIHELRTQVEVMKNTSTGKVDADLAATQTWLSRYIVMDDILQKSTDSEAAAKIKTVSSGHKSFNFAVVVPQQDDAGLVTDKVIGALGCHTIDPEPECGYMIRKEYWGKGIVTAVLKAFLEEYWKLERTTVTLPYDTNDLKGMTVLPETVKPVSGSEDTVAVPEVLTAAIESMNVGSKRVIQKCGFKYSWAEMVPDTQGPGEVSLEWYLLFRP